MIPTPLGPSEPTVDGAMLYFSDLTKTYPGATSPSIQNFSLGVQRSEILGLVGLNGAGKTTAIRVAAGVIRPTRGTVSVAGFNIIGEKTEASRHLGWVAEFPNLDSDGRAIDLLRYFAGFRGLSGIAAARHCSELLDLVGLKEVQRRRFRAFSQGMKKRLALAVAMVGDPEVMMLDEILNGLDPEGIALMRRLLIRWRNEGKAILLSTHLLSEVQQLADRVAIIHRGHLVRLMPHREVSGLDSQVLRIRVRNLDAGALAYLAAKGTLMHEDSTVWLAEPTAEPDEINAELTRKGYRITELVLVPPRLEDVFFDLIENFDRKGGDGRP